MSNVKKMYDDILVTGVEVSRSKSYQSKSPSVTGASQRSRQKYFASRTQFSADKELSHADSKVNKTMVDRPVRTTFSLRNTSHGVKTVGFDIYLPNKNKFHVR